MTKENTTTQPKTLDLYSRSKNDTVFASTTDADAAHENVKSFSSDSSYQWKTLAPSRAENVSLAFKVEQADVDNGYVIWMWELDGLYGGRSWKMDFTNLSLEKTMDLNGSTKTRNSSVDPYFMFPQTSFINSQQVLGYTNLTNKDDYDFIDDIDIRSLRDKGLTSYSKGRGTFATSATANSLTFQAESLFYGYDVSAAKRLTEADNAAYSNPVSLYIPLKNIQFDTDYKVTFDLSVARQGKFGVSSNGSIPGLTYYSFYGYDDTFGSDNSSFGECLVDYVDPFGTETNGNLQNQIFRKGEQLFSSYLYSGDPSVNRNENAHKADGFTQIKYANKTYQNEPLTKYDEINSLSSFQHSVTQSVNNTYNNAYSQSGDVKHKSESRNWYNAVLHTEYNGQNEIHWVTFYNTTFSFNIDGSNENNKSKLTLDENGFIQDLNWVWAMDSLISGCYYRIKLENVRIEKVVKYTSSLHPNGIKIAGTQIDPALHTVDDPSDNSKGYDATEDNDTLYHVVDTFRSFRGINGTGQNWQAKGFVLDASTDPKVLTSEGNIYAPIIDASKFTVRPNDTSKPKDANGEHPPTADAYKIALSGFAVCEGGVEKYVFSVDGGLTWHDMTFSGTDATTEPDPADSTVRNQLVLASRGVNQYVSGQTRYNASNFTSANLNMSEYTHYNFTEADGANANFSNFTLVADLSDYKNEANLDVIIAAVPTENINYRCEIVRIINFNQIRNYMTFPFDFVSDISVTNSNTSSASILNIHRLDETGASSQGHYHNGMAAPERMGFTMTKTWKLQTVYATDVVGPSSTTGYARMAEYSYKYENIRTLCSDMPVKKALSVTGWAMVENGVQGYYWSVDNGKTWKLCSGTAIDYFDFRNNGSDKWVSPQYADYYYSLDGRNDSTLSDTAKHRFEDSNDGKFNANTVEAKKNEFGTMLTADLSNYVGEVVDVIFAAKPNESDVYVPVGRIDNVAVYGDDGTFYTRLHRVIIDQCILEGDTNASEKYADTTYQFPDKTTWLSRVDNWDLGLNGYAYTIFEPNNVNVANTRLYHTEAAEIQSGGRVTIDGFVVCKGGVSRYKYSLDGGKTWTVINDAGANITANTTFADNKNSTMLSEAKKSDASFTVSDGIKGDYCCYYNYYSDSNKLDPHVTGESTKYYNHAIEFNLPALPAGAERNLLVVAESTNNKLIPVLHIKLKFKYADGNTMQYGYHSSINRTNLTTLNAGYVSNEQNWSFIPPANATSNATTNNVLDRITIPIDPNTQPGEYQLNFTHRLKNEPQTVSKTHQIWYIPEGTTTPSKNNQSTVDVSLSVEKTHFVVGEPIKVKFNYNYNKYVGGAGTAALGIVSEDWTIKDENNVKKQYTVCYHNGISCLANANKKERVIENIYKKGDYNFKSNVGLPNYTLGDNLPAGTYSIYFVSREKSIEAAKADSAKWLFGKITIYVHDPDEEITFSAVHDEGEETYFSDRLRQFVVGGTESNNKFDRQNELLYTLTKPFENDDERGISATVNITKEDVKRGYLILDVDYTKLLSKSRDPKNSYASSEHVRLYPGVNYNITLRFGQTPLVKKAENISNNVPFAGSSTGYGTTTMKIPVSAAGTYDLSFNGYLNNSVTHRGYAKSGTSSWEYPKGTMHQLTLDYTGAAMSIPKTVYTVGEDIPVSYYAKGSVAAKSPVKESGNLPWIGMYDHKTRTNPSTKEEIEAGRHYVQPDSSGVKYISTAGIEPGVYQIYLRDNSATLFHDLNDNVKNIYWWEYDMVEPITIVITNAANPVTNPQFEYDFSNVPHFDRQENTGFSSGKLSVNKNVFYQGDTIDITLLTQLDTTNVNFWFALCPEGSDSYVTWASASYTTLKTTGLPGITGQKQDATTTGSYKIPPGKYTLYLLSSGNVVAAHKNGRICAAMDITILPSTMKTAFKGATQIHSLELSEGNIVAKPQDVTPSTSISDPFSYYNVSGTFTVTQQDVERGYVMFEYDFTGLGSSVDLSFVIDNFTVTKRESS